MAGARPPRVDFGPMAGAHKALRRSICAVAPGRRRPHGRRQKRPRRPLCTADPRWRRPVAGTEKSHGDGTARPLPGGRLPHDRCPKIPFSGRSAWSLPGRRHPHALRSKNPSAAALRGCSRAAGSAKKPFGGGTVWPLPIGRRPDGRCPKSPTAAALRGRFGRAAALWPAPKQPFGGRSARPLAGGRRTYGRRPKSPSAALCAAAPGRAPASWLAPKNPSATALRGRCRVGAGLMVGAQKALRRPL